MARSLDWRPFPTDWTLPQANVDVWRVALDRPAGEVTALCALLTETERQRAGNFYFHRDRRQYIVTRAALRTLLGSYLTRDPTQLALAYTDHGRPYLQSDALAFNVSHAHNLALIAVALPRQLGIDLEFVERPLPDRDALAARFFSAQENQAYLALPAEQRQTGFFNCWTRKEAYIKAIGEGLSHPLHTFAVALDPAEAVRFLHIGGDPTAAADWSLHSFVPGPGYIAALAVEGQMSARFFDFSPAL